MHSTPEIKKITNEASGVWQKVTNSEFFSVFSNPDTSTTGETVHYFVPREGQAQRDSSFKFDRSG